MDDSLIAQLRPQLQELRAVRNAHRMGRVYCFRCEGTECEHVVPGSPTEVFAGYDQVGCPRWVEFHQLLLELGDERVDRLYARPPRLVTRLIEGAFLNSRQLETFGRGSKTFDILGQLVVGYFELPSIEGAGHDDRLALTFQIVDSRDDRGRARVELNVIFPQPDDDLFQERFHTKYPWVGRIRKQTARELGKGIRRLIRLKRKERAGEIASFTTTILRKLESSLAQGRRQDERRTLHARERREIQRPVHKAMDDLRQAKPEKLFWDQKTKAIMVCGDRGRCHAFSRSGQHITSFFIPPEAVQTRLRKRRWAILGDQDSLGFLRSFQPKSPAKE